MVRPPALWPIRVTGSGSLSSRLEAEPTVFARPRPGRRPMAGRQDAGRLLRMHPAWTARVIGPLQRRALMPRVADRRIGAVLQQQGDGRSLPLDRCGMEGSCDPVTAW